MEFQVNSKLVNSFRWTLVVAGTSILLFKKCGIQLHTGQTFRMFGIFSTLYIYIFIYLFIDTIISMTFNIQTCATYIIFHSYGVIQSDLIPDC